MFFERESIGIWVVLLLILLLISTIKTKIIKLDKIAINHLLCFVLIKVFVVFVNGKIVKKLKQTYKKGMAKLLFMFKNSNLLGGHVGLRKQQTAITKMVKIENNSQYIVHFEKCLFSKIIASNINIVTIKSGLFVSVFEMEFSPDIIAEQITTNIIVWIIIKNLLSKLFVLLNAAIIQKHKKQQQKNVKIIPSMLKFEKNTQISAPLAKPAPAKAHTNKSANCILLKKLVFI